MISPTLILRAMKKEQFAQGKVKRKIFGIELPHRFVVYDKLHRTFVFCAVTFTIITFTRLCVDIGHYYMYRKPVLKEMARYKLELEMRRMQAEKENEVTEDVVITSEQSNDKQKLQERLQAEADRV